MTSSSWRKSALFYLTALTVALAMTACAKGFKSKPDDSKALNASGRAIIPVSSTSTNNTSSTLNNPFLELAMAQSPEIAAIAKDPANQGPSKLLVDARIGFAITQLDPSGVSSAHDSVLYLSITVQGADGKQASTLVVSNTAELALHKSDTGDAVIEGYWTLNRPGQNYPYYIGVQSVAKPWGGTRINLEGQIVANFTGNGDVLATFDEPICQLVVDPTNWLSQFYGQYPFKGCAVEDAYEP